MSRQHFPIDQKDASNCQIFVEYLEGPALEWFSRLEPNSIDDFFQLIFAFVKHYSLYVNDDATDSDLYDLEPQGAKETVRNYMDRFKAVLSKVSVSDSSAISALYRGLCPESELRRDLVQLKRICSTNRYIARAVIFASKKTKR